MLTDLYNLVLAAVKLRGLTIYPSRFAVFKTYCRLKLLTYLGPRTTCRALGFEIHFFELKSFVYLFEEIFVHGTYAFRAPKSEPLILDAGSNIGISVLFFKWLYPDARILAFEPDPVTFAKLEQNVKRNALKNVEIFNCALSDETATAEFFSNTDGALGASLLKHRLAQGEAKSVSTRAFSSFLKQPVDFLKMDIEGAEAACLQEAAKHGALPAIREMVIECHHNLPGRKTILSEVLPLLEAHGFGFQIRGCTQVGFAEANLSQDVVLHVYPADA